MCDLGITSILSLFLETGMKNVALHKPANQSYPFTDDQFTWTADKAVDGCLLRNPYKGRCCSCTGSFIDNYWHLNLKDTYQVQRIDIYGRNDLTGKLRSYFILKITLSQLL